MYVFPFLNHILLLPLFLIVILPILPFCVFSRFSIFRDMKISYQWLKTYLPEAPAPEKTAEILTSIGLEVEAIEKKEAIPGGLAGVVVGEVLACAKHPDADRLSLTTVNVGAGDPLQIVCGAPNVAAGQKVLVATIGATLHPKGGEPFTIKKGKIRGQESQGMICAEDELGLGESHEGIMVLDAASQPGTSAADYLGLKADYCFEIGLTPNRTDAFSHIGVARDLAAALRNYATGASPVTLIKPAIDASLWPTTDRRFPVEIADASKARRYCGILLENIRVGQSPEWLVGYLNTIGVRSINNVVDLTNFVQHEIGQPLHAFDADKIAGGKVVVRTAKAGEKFTTLDGIERTLDEADLMICDAEKPMCIAGVFGGLESGVSEQTTRIFLESAWFDAVSVRKTARRHVLNTDASFRFERGTDPNNAPWALVRCVNLLQEISDATVASDLTDFYPTPAVHARVNYRWKQTESLIGMAIPREAVRGILADLDICIAAENQEGLELEIPLYRVDVTREADVVEEVLRIYGYNAVPFPATLRTSLSKAPYPDPEVVQHRVADYLVAQGFNEMMNMSLTKARYSSLVESEPYSETTAIALLNPLSNDLAHLRQTLLYSALEAIALNQNHRRTDVRLFEFGKEYRKQGTDYKEESHLALFLAGRRYPESWNRASDEVSFQDIKARAEDIFHLLGIAGYTATYYQDEHLSEGMQWVLGARVLVRWGRVNEALLAAFDIRRHVWYADMHWENLLASIPKQRTSHKAPEKFPAVRRDLSLLLDREVSFQSIAEVAHRTDRKLLREVGLFDVYEGKNLEAGKKSYAVRFVLQDAQKTLTDEAIEKTMDRILQALVNELNVSLRGQN
jgi:phenylalanyl-tRNA synthetase beta chain